MKERSEIEKGNLTDSKEIAEMVRVKSWKW